MVKRAILSLSVIALVLTMGCDTEADTLTDVDVSGRVTDAAAGVPVDNMTIELKEGRTGCLGLLDELSCFTINEPLVTTSTDQNGNYRLDYSHECSDDPRVELYLIVEDPRCSSNQARAIECTQAKQVVDYFCIASE